MKRGALFIPSIHSRPQCSAVPYGWFTGALPIQAGLCSEGRDPYSGQSCGGTTQQMAVQKNEDANELVAKNSQRGGLRPSSAPHRAAFGHDGRSQWTDGRKDGGRAGRAKTRQIMSSQAGASSQSGEQFCLRGFQLLSGQTVQSAGGDNTVGAVIGSVRRSSVFTVNTSEIGRLVEHTLCSAARCSLPVFLSPAGTWSMDSFLKPRLSAENVI